MTFYVDTRTEAEAAKSWCPEVGQSAGERYQALEGHPSAAPAMPVCIGSRCMLWVWTEPTSETALESLLPEDDPARPWRKIREGVFARDWPNGYERRGMCGKHARLGA